MENKYNFTNKKANAFTDIKKGDVVVCIDEYSREYDEHILRITSVEEDKEYITETNPKGIVAYGTDLSFYDAKSGEMVGDEYITVVNEDTYQRMADLQEQLWTLEANACLTVEGKYFDFHFYKDEDFDITKDENMNNAVSISICDKNGINVGGTGYMHLYNYSFFQFEAKNLETEFIERNGKWCNNLIDDNFEHKSFEEFEKEHKLPEKQEKEEENDEIGDR